MKDNFCDLPERIRNNFPEIDSDIVVDLRANNTEYAELRKRLSDMQNTNPFISAIIEGEAAISITTEEHIILSEYLNLKSKTDDIERQQIYFRGHTDSFAYLKKIGAI